MNGSKGLVAVMGIALVMALLAGVQSAARGGPTNDTEAAVQAAAGACLPAPGNLRATPRVRGALLQWQRVKGSTGYRIYWASKGDVIRPSAEVDDVASSHLWYGVRHLMPGVTYHFRVSALRSCKEGRLSRQVAAAATSRVPAPFAAPVDFEEDLQQEPAGNAETEGSSSNLRLPPPKKLRAKPEVRGVLLQWKPVKGSEGYRIYWETDGLVSRCSARLDDVPSDQLRYEVTDLEPGARYRFRVCTLLSSIEGPLSYQVGATPKEEERTGPSDDAP